jgi:hypothetical protein
LPEIEAAALRRLGASSVEELTEKNLERLKTELAGKYRSCDGKPCTEEQIWNLAVEELGRILFETEEKVEWEVFSLQIKEAVNKRLAEEAAKEVTV